ncbi:MAG: ATP-binding protein [Thermoanaerobaculaceae bacterium]
MVQFDNQYRQIKIKIVFYGPALGGKTTCLQYIHRVTDPQRRTRLYTLNTASDRTLFFDLLGLDLGRVRGYQLTLQLFTVPGQVQYNTTRKAVLAGADGVVFVADSQAGQEKANSESFANLQENLKANGLNPETIPLVLQYNKRDLPNILSRAQLDALLNPKGYPAFETVATTGVGVLEAFAAICEATVLSVADRLGVSAQPEALSRLVANVRSALAALVPTKRPEVEAPVVIRGPGRQLNPEELMAEAVKANTAMAELSARLDQLSQQLARRVEELRGLLTLSQVLSQAREPDEVATAFFERFLVDLRVTAGSLMLINSKGELVEVLRRGLAADPLMRLGSDTQPPARVILTSHQLYLANLEDMTAQQLPEPWLEEMSSLGFSYMVAVPLVAQDRELGLVAAYGERSRGPFLEDDLQLAAIMGAVGATALANARSWQALEQLNRNLERLVGERTAELEKALAKSESLARELAEANRDLEAAYRKLAELDTLKGELLQRVAHELNTPVTALQTAGRILTRWEHIPKEKVTSFVNVVVQESGRLAELVASALQAAALSLPEAKGEKSEVSVVELLRNALAPVKGEMADRQISIAVKVASGLEKVTCYPEALEAGLAALAKNAVEFNKFSGAVTITVLPVRKGKRSLVEFRFEDTGVGISPEELPHVTEPFFQTGSLLTDKPRGLGLGLTVAKKVAELHGGELEISSQPGTGTTVMLRVEAD